MYRLTKDGKGIALANTMHYIRMQDNGAYALCDKLEADGVAADNKVYHFGSEIDKVEFVDGVEQLEIMNIILEGETL